MTSPISKFALNMLWGAALLAILTCPARAQILPGFNLNQDKEISEDEKERNRANEKAAKEAQKSIVAPKASSDPWGDVRAADTPAKSGPKPKAGTK